MTGAVLRRMGPQDVDAVAAMEHAVFSDAWSRDSFAREVSNRGCMPWVALDQEGKLLGYMVAWFVADEAHLGNIAVDPAYRRKGLARRFLEVLFEEARRRGAVGVFLEVRRSNRAAKALYEEHDFEVISIRKRYYSDNQEDALIMRKHLTRKPEGTV